MKSRTILFTIALLLTVGIGWLVFKKPAAALPGSSDPHAVALDVEIKNVTVRKSGDHAQLILTASFKQSGQSPVRLEPPLMKLLTADGKTAPRYLGPMLPEPILTGPEETSIILHYWLPLTDLGRPLMLEAAGKQHSVPLP